jgi:demethylmenaquinone methyltransferase/2-methoxy-6-polyprenyl-1,4-benzoquinol methylase
MLADMNCIADEEAPSRPRRFGRYTVGARLYDVVSLEWPIYAAGRQVGIDLLDLQPGARVLDLGCGTGLNFGRLQAAVGPAGAIVGIDLSRTMLARAQARVRRHGWANVRLEQANVGCRNASELVAANSFDAVLFTYALSVIDDSTTAWRTALAALRPGGRIAVVDLAMPHGPAAALAPLAALACTTGGVHWRRQVWQWVARDTACVQQQVLRAGHIRVAAGTSRPDLRREPNVEPGPG